MKSLFSLLALVVCLLCLTVPEARADRFNSVTIANGNGAVVFRSNNFNRFNNNTLFLGFNTGLGNRAFYNVPTNNAFLFSQSFYGGYGGVQAAPVFASPVFIGFDRFGNAVFR